MYSCAVCTAQMWQCFLLHRCGGSRERASAHLLGMVIKVGVIQLCIRIFTVLASKYIIYRQFVSESQARCTRPPGASHWPFFLLGGRCRDRRSSFRGRASANGTWTPSRRRSVSSTAARTTRRAGSKCLHLTWVHLPGGGGGGGCRHCPR